MYARQNNSRKNVMSIVYNELKPYAEDVIAYLYCSIYTGS